MILHPNPVLGSRLLWLADKHQYVAEMSEIGGFGRVYDDACDEGFTIVSRYDGKQAVFAVNHEERDSDGDVQWWDLIPAGPSRFASAYPFTVRIFND